MNFLDMMRAGFKVKEAFPDAIVSTNKSSGIMTIQVYVGIENAELFQQGQEMFSEA